MFLPGNELGLAEAYLYNDFDIEGDVATVYTLVEDLTILADDFFKQAAPGMVFTATSQMETWVINTARSGSVEG
jgi:hypothetical protein